MSTLRQSADGILREVVGHITRALGAIKTPWLRRHLLQKLSDWLQRGWAQRPRLRRGGLPRGRRQPFAMSPVKHVGATERFGAELRALRQIEVSPELVSDIETELRWGLIWHDFERTMQDEIDRVFAKYLQPECVDFDDLRELIGLSEPTVDLQLVAA
ncbi:MAG: hypothetical protein J2P15_18520 [Micromonosporaceae bacterium]|nr:hypothetical protein [Micromonosporaceae bacterium]